MVPPGWQVFRPGRDRPTPAWVSALEPLTTGLLAQDDLRLWTAGTRAALGIRPGGVIYPVLPQALDAFWQAGAQTILERVPESWCLMGPSDWVQRAEALMPLSRIQHRVSYEFLVRSAQRMAVPEGPGVCRPSRAGDLEDLFPLQEAYEKEEVLFDPRDFSPLASRIHLLKALRHQKGGALWVDGRPVAKAATNALTGTWAQVGGVYTLPEWRGRGLQKRLLAFLLDQWAAEGRGACLFVKSSNAPALGLYRRLGFASAVPFSITYGQRRTSGPVFP